MTHGEAQELIGADPENASPELLEHLKSCSECQAYHEQMLALNAKLRRALELDWRKVQRTSPPSAPPTELPTSKAMPGTASQRPISRSAGSAPVEARTREPSTAAGTARPQTPAVSNQRPATSPPTASPAGSQPVAPERLAGQSATTQPAAAGRDAHPAAIHPVAAGRDAQPPATHPVAAERDAQPPATHPVAAERDAQPAPGQRPAPQPSAPPTADRPNVTPLRRKQPAPVAKHKRPRLFAFAASLAAALLVGFTLWLSRPPETLAAEIVAHVEGEPNSWSKTEPVSAQRLAAVLRQSGVKLGAGMQPVVYANSCWFRGHFVPHFVVTTQDGPVTVMILAHEQIQATQQFNEGGYSGLLVPAPTGGVAVVSRTPMSLEQPASAVVKALQAADQGTSTALPSRL
jgi:hypothetical protein